jgi:dienelactone hydrolase
MKVTTGLCVRIRTERRRVMALLATVLALPAFAQSAAEVFGLAAGEHAVGFQLLEDEDRSRVVTGGARGAVHARPMRTYIWYPAAPARRAPPVTFGRYVELAQGDVWPASIGGPLSQRLPPANGPLARSLSPPDYAALLGRPMRAVENAQPLAGPFPLVVIGLGLYYESPVTFSATAEYLAGHGFAVVTAPFVGTHTHVVKLDTEDLETQVRDLEFAIARARQFSFVSVDRLGVYGFDMGGMAGVVLAMRNRDVDAFVSADSGIQAPHPSGLPRASTSYDPLALRVPWLHIAHPRNDQAPPGVDPKRLFDEAVHSDRYLVNTTALGHADHTSYGLIDNRGAVPNYWQAAAPAQAAAHRAVVDRVRRFFTAHLAGGSFELAEADVRDALADPGATLEHRSAVAAPIGYDELVRRLVGGEGAEAVAGLRALAAASPSHPLLTEFNLQRLAVSLLFTWNLPRQTLPLAEFTRELYPESPGVAVMLGETQALAGDTAAAIATFEQLLERMPGNPAVQSRLEQLRR